MNETYAIYFSIPDSSISLTLEVRAPEVITYAQAVWDMLLSGGFEMQSSRP